MQSIVKKYKIILQKTPRYPKNTLYRLFTDAELEENKKKVKDYHFSSFEIDHRHKICSVDGCNKTATHGQNETMNGKIIKENWKCKECYGNKRNI